MYKGKKEKRRGGTAAVERSRATIVVAGGPGFKSWQVSFQFYLSNFPFHSLKSWTPDLLLNEESLVVKQKIVRFALSRGFESDIVWDLLKTMDLDNVSI